MPDCGGPELVCMMVWDGNMFSKGDKVFILELLWFTYIYSFGIVLESLVETMGMGAINVSFPRPPLDALPDYFFGAQEPPYIQGNRWNSVSTD